MMVKEHFIEDVRPGRRTTIGWGGSGGAIQQYDIADAYPGIVDGIVPGVSFPDPFRHARPGHRLPPARQLFRRGRRHVHGPSKQRAGRRFHVVRHLQVLGRNVRQTASRPRTAATRRFR